MDLVESICKELKKPYDDKIVKFVIHENSNAFDEPFLVVVEKNTVEIICFKKTMIRIFTICHEMFNQRDQLTQDEIYYMCIGLLLSTSENRTVLNIYRDIMQSLPIEKLNDEIKVIERMLSSNNPRLNKSSSLWELYRQTFAENKETGNFNVWNTITLSSEQHFANYYCFSFLRWYSEQLKEDERSVLVRNMYDLAKRNMHDVSIWNALSYIIDDSFIDELINFIEYLPVTSWCPFIPILESAHRNPELVKRIRNRWSKKDVLLEKDSLIIPDNIENDLNKLTRYKKNGYTTLLLCKLDQLS